MYAIDAPCVKCLVLAAEPTSLYLKEAISEAGKFGFNIVLKASRNRTFFMERSVKLLEAELHSFVGYNRIPDNLVFRTQSGETLEIMFRAVE